MRRRLAVAPVLKGTCIAAALAASSLAQAASVQAVFSAENALYGAGYNIGQADGWIDDNLREALRQFQAARPGLTTTGELDSKTLAALGISGQSSQLMGGNVVASREAARKELGLVVASLAKPVPQPTPEPQPRSKPEPQPEPVVATVSAPEPEPKPVPEPVVVEKAASVATKAPETGMEAKPEPEPQVVTAPPEPVEPEPAAPVSSEKQAEPEPTSEPIQIASITRSDSQPVKQDKPEEKRAEAQDAADKSVEVASVANDDVNDVASTEATQGAQQVAELPRETSSPGSPASSESSGNFLTKMFDFLFGWMV